MKQHVEIFHGGDITLLKKQMQSFADTHPGYTLSSQSSSSCMGANGGFYCLTVVCVYEYSGAYEPHS